jgi:hypothetical protein
MGTASITIAKWAEGHELTLVLEAEDGKVRGWMRDDGRRAIETQGDSIFEDERGFDAGWAYLEAEVAS